MKQIFKPLILLSMLAASIPAFSQQGYQTNMQNQEYQQRREDIREQRREQRRQERRNMDYDMNIVNPGSSMIQYFQVNMPDSLFKPGATLNFVVDGEQNGVVNVKFNSSGNITRVLRLRETEPGLYTGSYVVRSVDKLRNKTFTANMLYKKRNYVAKFEPTGYSKQPVQRGVYNDRQVEAHRPSDRYVNSQPVINRDFGTVIAVEPIQNNTGGVNVAGSVLGAAAGGLIGNQIGGGSGKTAATVIGALGGAYAGNQVGQNMNQTTQYRVTVQFEDNSRQTYMVDHTNGLAVNSKVRRNGNDLVLR